MKQLTIILKETVFSSMFSLTYPKDTVLNVTLMNGRIYAHYPKNENCLTAISKSNIKEANFKFKGKIDIEHSGLDTLIYFKDEGDYLTYKLTKDGKLTDPNKTYEFGTLQTLVATGRKHARTIAKSFQAKPIFV